MATILSENNYQHVPAEQRERLWQFRATHPRKQVEISGQTWSYLLGGQGSEHFLILPGGERIGDIAFPLMQQFEQEYCCLYPSYPPAPRMGELVDGLATLLDRLSVKQVILFAASFGGDVGQCFIRKYPHQVSKLILLNTGLPNKRQGKAAKCLKPLITFLPFGIVRSLMKALLRKGISTRPEEQLFAQAMLHELAVNLTRADILSSFEETIDYRLNYHFLPTDLKTWQGKILLLQSDDDPATSPTMRLAIQQIYPQAQKDTFLLAGHTPFLSQPDKFYPLVRTFLRQS
jgi:pimeloyl-ACP methyl ester carboxylesterase